MLLDTKYLKIRFIYIDEAQAMSIIRKSLNESTLDLIERNMFSTMFDAFGFKFKLQNAYFRVCEYTDGKFTLNVRKDLHDYITINFKVNPMYNGLRINS